MHATLFCIQYSIVATVHFCPLICPRKILYILVKALAVTSVVRENTARGVARGVARGEAECCICHSPPPLVLYFIVQHEYTVLLLICWFCVGGLLVFFHGEEKALARL